MMKDIITIRIVSYYVKSVLMESDALIDTVFGGLEQKRVGS